MEKRNCSHHNVCGMYADAADEAEPLCILHSKNPDKNRQRFNAALEKHRSEKGDDFRWLFFPEEARFFDAKFSKEANFSVATFSKEANFVRSTFIEKADFSNATFSKDANFFDATFSKEADFSLATFSERARFFNVTFSEGVDFYGATFFGRTTFIGEPTKDKAILIFSEVKNEVNFRAVNIDPPQALIFRDADLTKCLFEQTDLRKAEFTGVSWPKPGWRYQVYDEICPLKTGEFRKWDHIERLYRELKQNYEDRRDYERAGDFHYGEKEMRRKNPETPPLLRWLLTLYWAVSGYGERYIRPFVWALLLLVASTCGYLILGIAPNKASILLALTNWENWLDVGLYSLQVMTLLRPTDLVPLGTAATAVKVFQSLLGPIFIGLFALAVRQRLKR